MKSGERYEIEITAFDHEGRGICRINGYTVFVENAVMGDQLLIELTKCNKNYGFGKIIQILTPSVHRGKPNCLHYQKCGACQFMHIEYSFQLAMKKRIVADALSRIGGFSHIAVNDVIGTKEVFRYRNKSQFPVINQNGRTKIGYYERNSHKAVNMTDCLVSNEAVSALLSIIRRFMDEKKIAAYDEAAHTGFIRHVFVRNSSEGRQIMAVIVINGTALPHQEELVQALIRQIPNLKSIYLNINQSQTNLILGPKSILIYGNETITDTILGKKFSISPESFYQVNCEQTQVLYQTAIDMADIRSSDTVFDLYCGIGTISLCAAGLAKEVIGVEYVNKAVLDAEKNAEINSIPNVRFYAGAAEQIVPELVSKGVRADKVILDPPRKGAQPEVLEAIANAQPEQIVYVSCNPATLARDLKLLCERGFKLCEVQPVDMFPQTNHVETVVLLSKGEIDSKKVRVEFSLEDMDMSGFQKGATYEQIKAYVLEKFGLKVSSLYISQIKRKCGLDVGQNYNLSKKEDAKVPQCPPEKEAAIMEALKHFQMLE